ncbi:hypothetical protein SUGI_0373280 [Cryptomeria japonica]|nr:hypothetical protein SUGI_0373280 [Cryptomeria japonica]
MAAHALWRKIITQNDENPFSQAPNLQAALILDCAVDESQRWADMVAFLRSLSDMEVHVAQHLSNLKRSGTPTTCIVADVFLRWAVPFAKTHALHSVSLCPMSVTNFSIFYHLNLGLEGWKDYIAESPPLQLTDIPARLIDPSRLGNEIVECFANVRRADSIVAMNGWIPNSFGSVHNAARPQVKEIAAGLFKSGCYFVWALRLDNDASHFSEMLPTEFIDECEGQGLIAAWFGQAEIRKHPAVGGF